MLLDCTSRAYDTVKNACTHILDKPTLNFCGFKGGLGTQLPTLNHVVFGGLIRDYQKNFIEGFYEHEGVSNPLLAEIIALCHGLKVQWDSGFNQIVDFFPKIYPF